MTTSGKTSASHRLCWPISAALLLLIGVTRSLTAISAARGSFALPPLPPPPPPSAHHRRAAPTSASLAPLEAAASAPRPALRAARAPRPAPVRAVSFLAPLDYGTLSRRGADGQVVRANPPKQSRCHTSKKYGFMFVHITKCGGSAILNNIKDILCVAAGKAKGCALSDADGRLVYGCKALASEKLFTFTFVRNPWDRAVSDWGYGLKRELATCKEKGSGKAQCEETRARGYCSFRDYIFRNASVPKGRRCGYHTETQWEQAFTKEKHPAVNFLGRLEAFERDFVAVLQRVDASGKLAAAYARIGFTMHNDSPRADYRDVYSAPTRARVARDHADDISLLKYTFEDGTRRKALNKMVSSYHDGAPALALAHKYREKRRN